MLNAGHHVIMSALKWAAWSS